MYVQQRKRYKRGRRQFPLFMSLFQNSRFMLSSSFIVFVIDSFSPSQDYRMDTIQYLKQQLQQEENGDEIIVSDDVIHEKYNIPRTYRERKAHEENKKKQSDQMKIELDVLKQEVHALKLKVFGTENISSTIANSSISDKIKNVDHEIRNEAS